MALVPVRGVLADPVRRGLSLLQLCSIGMLVGLCYLTPRTSIGWVWGLFAGLIVLYLLTLRLARREDTSFLLGWAVVSCLAVVFAMPRLTDDIFRHLWDARVWYHGLHPFALRPVEMVELLGAEALPFRVDELYPMLYSRHVFASYPPLLHFLMFCTAAIAPASLWAQAITLKLLLLSFLLATILLLPYALRLYGVHPRASLWFALHPLIPIELVANAHLESPMLLFVLLFLIFLRRKQWLIASVALAMAINGKLVPLVFLPWLIKRLGWWRAFISGFVVLVIAVIAHVCMLPSWVLWSNYRIGLSRFFQNFHFNGSLTYLVLWPSYVWTGDYHVDEIGRIFSLLIFVVITSVALHPRRQESFHRFPMWMLFSWVVFLWGSLVVHPWYLAVPMMLACFTRFRFMYVWAAVIPLSYAAYVARPYAEDLWLVALEYALVWFVAAREILVLKRHRPWSPEEHVHA